jgi:hypothetical protein
MKPLRGFNRLRAKKNWKGKSFESLDRDYRNRLNKISIHLLTLEEENDFCCTPWSR